MRRQGFAEGTSAPELNFPSEAAKTGPKLLHRYFPGAALFLLFIALYGPTIRGLVIDWVSFYSHSH